MRKLSFLKFLIFLFKINFFIFLDYFNILILKKNYFKKKNILNCNHLSNARVSIGPTLNV